jgi:hypothetical protein
MNVARSTLAYQSARAMKDAPVLARMAELSSQYPRYGYRRIAIFLARDGHPMSFGRAHRLWRQARLQVPQKASPQADCGRASPAQRAGGRQSGVELRFRLRLVCQRAKAKVPDRDR